MRRSTTEAWDCHAFPYMPRFARDRCAANIRYPEYDDLGNEEAVRKAKILSLQMDHHILLRRETYQNVQEWITDLMACIHAYLNN